MILSYKNSVALHKINKNMPFYSFIPTDVAVLMKKLFSSLSVTYSEFSYPLKYN